jgi:hypothetical protein
MAIITVPSATQGRSYNVKISGDAPTPTEQARIAQYVAEQDAASQARVEKYFGAQQQQAPEAPEKGGLAGLSTALGRSVDITQQGAYSALEGLGSSTGIDWLREFGRAGAEANTKQLEESQAARTQYEDIQGVGSAASFVGETVAESAVPMGISIAGAAGTGAAAGAALTAWAGPGAALGAGAGAIIGAAGAALSQLPLFYGWNRERQKQEDVTAGRPVEINEGTALLAAIPQATIEGITDRFLIGKLLPPTVINKGGLLTRLVKGSTAGVLAEVPTEVGQQILERYQAGLPLDDDQAFEEYKQAAIAAAAAGGTIGGVSTVIGGDQNLKDKAKADELKKKQLLEDDASMQKDYEATQIFAAQNEAELAKANAPAPQAQDGAPEAPLMLPAPKAGEPSTLKVAPIVNPAAYTPEMRSRAVAFATSGKNFTLGEFHQHMNEVTKTNVPKQSIANLMADLKSERIIRTDYRTGSTSASRKFAPTKYAAQARERLDSFTNESATLEAEAKSLSDVNDKLSADLRAAEQTGADLSGKKANTSAIGRQIDQNTASIAQKLKRATDARAEAAKMPESLAPSPVERTGLPPGIKAAPLSQATPKAAAPRQEAIQQSLADNINAVKALASKKKSLSGRQLSSIEQVALDDTERKIAALKLRRVELVSQAKSPEAAIQDAQNQEAADNAKALAAQVRADAASRANEQAQLQTMGVAQPSSGPATAPVFDTKAQNVFGALRGRLNKLGLGNVRLATESTLGARGEASGTYNPKQRLIALAMGIYDPKLSEQELFDRVARVMDHEAIHALKSVGVFNDAEWASLTRAAKEMKYKAMKNGKLEERSYSYLDRAENMYDGTIPRADWGSTTIATDLISPQVLKALRKAAGKSKVKLGETVSLETIDKLVGEQTATEVAKIEFAAEEAVAEMFGDYVQGRIKFVGKPKTLFERIKTFFRGLIGASVDSGITDAQSILDDIQSGAVGARQQAPISAAGAERQSAMTPQQGEEDGSQNAPPQGERIASGIEQVRREVRPDAETGIDAAGIGASQHPVTVEELFNPDTDFEEFVKRPGWAAFSATNNKIEPQWRKVEQRAQSMRDHLNFLKIPFREVYGYYHGETDGPSFLVIMDPEAARKFAAQYQQDSILTSAGLIYIRNVPPTLSTGEVMFGNEAKIQEGYTYIPDKDLAFSLGLDDSTWPGTPVIPDGYELVEKRPQLPVKDGKVRLLHWSPRVLTELNPAYAGKREGPTANIIGAERNDRHKKVFFGINPRESGRQRGTGYIKENLGENMHEVFVDPKSLYPWFQDPDGLWSGPTRIKELNQQERNEYEGLIIKAGYLGSYVTEDGDTNLDVQSYAPLGNVASIYYPIKVNHVTPERQSRMVAKVQPVKNVSEELKRLTVLDMMDPKTGTYIQREGKKITVMDALYELFNRRSDVVINSDDPGAVDRMAELIALEAQMAILRNPGAIGWYGETLTMAKRVAAIMYPEISKVNPYTGEPSNSYVAMNEHIWDLATAITSNGQAVLDNFTHAAEQYEYWKVHGRFKLIGYGKQSTGIISGLKFYNAMRDVGYSDEQVQEFLNLKMPVSELKKHPVVQRLGIKIGSSEKASTEVYGSYVLGPKIGQGFYQNLRGNFTPLTMDIWFNRLFNRISGKPFAVVTDKTRLANYERISALINNPMMGEYEKGLLEAAKAVASIDVLTPENVGDLAIAYDKLFQRDFANTKIKEMKRLVALGYDPKADETKALGNAARPVKTELIQAMSTASKNFKDSEQAAPRGGGERAFMREVIDRAQTKVLQATGLEVNTADFQALLWYAEKQLFKAMNIREGRGGDNDYVDGVIHFLRSRGISDEEIKRVLPTDQRDRLTSGTDSGRANAGVLSGAEAPDSGQADSGNQLLSEKPNGQREAAVARNGGVGGRVKPKRGAAAVAAAKADDPVRLSRMLAHAPQALPTPYTGPSDLMKHTDTLRYAAVQGAVSRLIQRTVGKYFKIDPQIIDDKTAGFFKKMQDDMIHVGKMYDNLRAKGINIPQEFDSYFQDQLMRDAAGAKKQDFQEGFLRKIVETAVGAKFNSTNVDALDKAVRAATNEGSYVSEIVKKVGNESHAISNAYLYALHAKERNKRIKDMSKGKDVRGSGMPDAEADAILNWVKTLPQSQQTALDNVDKLAQDIVWMTNDEYIQGGLIPVYNDDKATLDDGSEVDFPQYDNYVPLRGFTDTMSIEEKSEGGGGFGKFSGSVPNKAAVGRASYAGDILVNIGTQYEAAVDKAARNKVGQSMLNLIENNASEMSAIAFVLKDTPLKKVVVNGTIRNVPDRDFSDNEKNLPILPVRRNGKEILIGFHDKNIADAMKGNVSASAPNAVFSAVHNITRVYANLLTSWNPAFVLSNLPRDIETAIFNSQQYNMKGSAGSIIKKVGPSIKAIWGVINDTGAGDPHLRMRYRQFYENGGQSVFNGMVNLSNSTASVQNIIKEVEGLEGGNALFKSKHFFTKTLLGKVENANTAVENGTRLAFFDAMMNELEAQGVPTKVAAKRAAYAAKNLTTNFTKGGDFRNGLNTAYLFYNASLQGSMAMMNSLVRSKKARKMAASIVIMGFVMDMLNAAASDDEDDDGILDYDNFNENRLTKYILIPDFTGSGTHISIPMAYGLNIFYNAGRTLSNYVRGVAGAKGTYTASEAAASTVGQVVSTLNPFGGNNVWSFLSPTQLDPIVELMSNKDFKDQPIYKELSPFDQSKSRSNLYWSTTSPSAVFVSKFLNDTLGGGTDVIPGEILGQRMDIQPDVIEHVLGFLTGGLGSFLGASLDTATSTVPDAMSGKWSADMVGKTPILNKFLTQVSEKDKAGDYYTNRDKVMVVRAEIKDAIAAGDGERIAAAKATYPERIKVMGRIGEIEKRLTKLRKAKKLITESTKMDEAKKQKSIDNINQAINKLMALGNQIMGDAGV